MNNSSNSVLPVGLSPAPATDARRSVPPASDTGDSADQSWSRALQAAAPKRSADAEPQPGAAGDAGQAGEPGQDPGRQELVANALIWTGPPGPGAGHRDPQASELGAPEQPNESPAAAIDLNAPLDIALSSAPDAPALRLNDEVGAMADRGDALGGRSSDAPRAAPSTLAEPADAAIELPDLQTVTATLTDGARLQRATARAGSPSGGEAGPEPLEASRSVLNRLATSAQGSGSGSLPGVSSAGALSQPASPEMSAVGLPAGQGPASTDLGASTTNRAPEADSRSSLLSAATSLDADGAKEAPGTSNGPRLTGGKAQGEQTLTPAAAAQAASAPGRPAAASPASADNPMLSAELRIGRSSQSGAGSEGTGAAPGTVQSDLRAVDPDGRGALRGTADPDQFLQSLARDAATAFELKPATSGGGGNLQALSLSPATITAEGTPLSAATQTNASAQPATAAATNAASVAASPQQLALALGDARELGQELGRLLSRGQLDGQRSLSVTLYPEELGRLDIRVASAGEQGVAVTIQAQLPQVRDLLEAQVGRLRAALGEGGFTEVEVDLGERTDDRDSSDRRASEQDASAHQQASGATAMLDSQADDGLARARHGNAATARAPGFNAYA